MPGAEAKAVANMHVVPLFRNQQTESGEVSKRETPATAAHSWPIALGYGSDCMLGPGTEAPATALPRRGIRWRGGDSHSEELYDEISF